MSLLFMDGMDCYDSVADVLAAGSWIWGGSNAGTISLTGGRFGGGCLTTPSPNNPNYWQVAQQFDADKDYIVGFSWKNSGAFTANGGFMRIMDSGGNTLVGLVGLSTGAIRVVNVPVGSTDVTIADSAAGVLTPSVWARIELKFNRGTDTTSGSLELRVNEVSVLNLTDLNLWRTGLDGVAARFYGFDGGSNIHSIDDVTINDTEGDVNNDFIGDIRIDTLKPTADTAIKDWSPDTGTVGYSRIDDPNGASDGDTSFLQTATVGAKSEFDLTNVIGVSANIYAMQARVKAEKTDVGTRTYKAYLKSNGTIADSDAITPSVGTYTWAMNGIVEKNPDGDVVWTDLAVNNMKLGLELVS